MTAETVGSPAIGAREGGFWHDLWAIAGRALRAIPREKESVIPALLIPVFWLLVSVGALETIAGAVYPGLDFRGFQLPVAVVFAATGVSRAPDLVLDIQNGYFDRLTITPVRRSSLLLGMMMADLALVIALTIPVLVIGWGVGVRFASGPAGVLVFLILASLWGLAFTGFLYAIALKTANPAAITAGLLLFFPFAFLTTAFLPQSALSGWMATAAEYNPMTYLLAALRSLILAGWEWDTLVIGFGAIMALGIASFSLAFAALRSRLRPR
jgi:ABC-2 type transport system permease protein